MTIQTVDSVGPDSPAFASALAGKAPLSTIDGIYTVDTLPDPQANIDKYAIVTDLFGVKRDRVLASSVGSYYFWQPVRPTFGATLALTANTTLSTLKNPSIIRLTGTIGVGITRTITLDPTSGFPGAQFEISASGLGTILGTLNIVGTGLGSAVGVVTGGYKKFFLDYSGGSLAWVQLI